MSPQGTTRMGSLEQTAQMVSNVPATIGTIGSSAYIAWAGFLEPAVLTLTFLVLLGQAAAMCYRASKWWVRRSTELRRKGDVVKQVRKR